MDGVCQENHGVQALVTASSNGSCDAVHFLATRLRRLVRNEAEEVFFDRRRNMGDAICAEDVDGGERDGEVGYTDE